MSLLTPSFGLLFWMVISFAFVFGILAKFGFPVITKAVNERRDYIRESLDKADEANRVFDSLKQQSEELIEEAKKHRMEMIRQATAEANRIIQKAKDEASRQGRERLDETIRLIEMQKQKAIGEIRAQVALLSVDIAEKVLRRRLDDTDNHDNLISQFLDEIEDSDIIKN
ncbi:MAG: F0F1 ATP synthase subunit B [Tannerella sp.]|jgi:F-type H+-transporting ATPase subunit b|nr:F0F1 ATP synthase subunit B [Tannerella sp.]